MALVVKDELGAARRRKRKAQALVNPFVVEIVEALFELGGEAHRDVVINMAAYKRGSKIASPALASELLEAFELHMGQADVEKAPALFNLPFGEGSRRWSLTREARRLLSAGKRRA